MLVRRQLPFALLATTIVVVLPALVGWIIPGGPLVAILGCAALSMLLSAVVSVVWERLPQSRDVLFSDLMLWGWVRRLRTERRLEHAGALVASGQAVTGNARALERLSTMLESRDVYTRRHSLRVARHCEGIARELRLPEADVAKLRTAGALHDIGKLFTPREVLNKPDRLDDTEFEIVKRHAADGADLVEGVVAPEIVGMIRYHHERLSGGGYPDGLEGDAIPFGARVIAVADTFDAMTSTRAYRAARPHLNALRVLREEAGVALDASAVEAFLTYYTGRHGTRWSSALSGLTHVFAPVRELLLSGGRALPALAASAALAVPALAAPAPDTPARRDRSAAPLNQRSNAERVAARLGVPLPASHRSLTQQIDDVRHGRPVSAPDAPEEPRKDVPPVVTSEPPAPAATPAPPVLAPPLSPTIGPEPTTPPVPTSTPVPAAPTPEASPTPSPAPEPTPSPSPEPSPSPSPEPSPSPSPEPTPSPSPEPTPSPSPEPTPSPSPEPTPSPSPEPSPSPSPSPVPTASPSPSPSPVPTASPTATPGPCIIIIFIPICG